MRLSRMNDVANWKVPKWPFLLGNVLLLVFAYFIVSKAPHPISNWEIIACFAMATIGALIGIFPFYLDYRAMEKALEINALGTVTEKIQSLENISESISSATNHWAVMRDSIQAEAGKTTAAAKSIADQMAGEVRQFNEWMQKMNDSEKITLRLEVEKLHRSETEWLQILVRILDQVFALHTAAVRTGDPNFAEPITNFQNACREIARRIGLVPFVAGLDEPFNPERHQVAGGKEKPPASAVVTETVGTGYTFQGKLLRPAIVRVREPNTAVSKPTSAMEAAPVKRPPVENAEAELPL